MMDNICGERILTSTRFSWPSGDCFGVLRWEFAAELRRERLLATTPRQRHHHTVAARRCLYEYTHRELSLRRSPFNTGPATGPALLMCAPRCWARMLQ